MDLTDEILGVSTCRLEIDRLRFQISEDRTRFQWDSSDYGRRMTCALDAMIARLPDRGRLTLPATWRDAVREALYAWLLMRRSTWLHKRLAWPGFCYWLRGRLMARWPVRRKTYLASCYLPYALDALGLPAPVTEGAFSVFRVEPSAPANPQPRGERP